MGLADDTIQFDGRFLDLKGNTKIDLGRFSQKGYVEPGKYNLRVHVNNQPLPDDYDIYQFPCQMNHILTEGTHLDHFNIQLFKLSVKPISHINQTFL